MLKVFWDEAISVFKQESGLSLLKRSVGVARVEIIMKLELLVVLFGS